MMRMTLMRREEYQAEITGMQYSSNIMAISFSSSLGAAGVN